MADDQSAGVPLSPAGEHLAKVAARSMFLAVRDEDDEAAALVAGAIEDHGWEAISHFLQGWPLLMQAQVYPHTVGHPELIGTFVPHDSATGQTCGVDDLPPNIAWAGRWIRAIITADMCNASALWELLGEDEDIGPYLDAVLTATSSLIRRRETGQPTGPGL